MLQIVCSGVGSTCGYYRVVVNGCVQSPVLCISMYTVVKSRQYTYNLSVSVHVHVEVCGVWCAKIMALAVSSSQSLEAGCCRCWHWC